MAFENISVTFSVSITFRRVPDDKANSLQGMLLVLGKSAEIQQTNLEVTV